MGRVVKAELYQLKYNKAFYVILVLAAALIIGLSVADDSAMSFKESFASFGGMVPLLQAVIVVSLCHKDFNEGTLKNIASSGVSRFSIYLGKVIVAFLASMVIFLIEAIATLGFDLFAGTTIVVDAVFIIKALALQALVVLNYTVLYYLIASVIHSSALAITVSFVICLIGSTLLGYASSFLHISGLADYELGAVAVEVEKVSVNTVSIMHLAVITAVILVAGFVGAFVFSKKDIK